MVKSGAGSIGRAFSATALPKASRMICRKSLVAWAASFDIFPSILSYDFFAFLLTSTKILFMLLRPELISRE